MNNILAFDGELYLINGFYPDQQAQQLFKQLRQSLAWQQEKIFVYGRWLNVPRLMSWYGDKQAEYKYSGVNHQPLPWTEDLLAVKQKIQSFYPSEFNSVMANLYRDGNDSMGCHADDEKELGENPIIASLSLGEQRLLRFRHQQTKEKLDVPLNNGDLLIMAGEIQHHWHHELPKTKKSKAERINLTFRHVYNMQAG